MITIYKTRFVTSVMCGCSSLPASPTSKHTPKAI